MAVNHVRKIQTEAVVIIVFRIIDTALILSNLRPTNDGANQLGREAMINGCIEDGAFLILC